MLETILSGCRVLDLTQNVAGPFCAQTLGDLGAEIIKIACPGSGDDARQWKPPEMGGQSTGFLALNRNKKSVCIDLDTAPGRQLARRLAATADVLVHSLKPGSAESRGLGWDDLHPSNPRLVYCAISAFGEVGPMRALPGYDALMQAFTGIMSVSGHEGDEPARVGVSLIDMGTGMWATTGILAALLRRASTGQGMAVHARLLETGLSWMTVSLANYLATGKLPCKMGSAMAMMAPYELFDRADGKVFITAANDRLFAKVCGALGKPELAVDARFVGMSQRIANREALHTALEARTRLRNTEANVAALRSAGAPCSEMHDVAQVLAHEQVRAVGMLTDLPIAGAPRHKAMGLPINSQGRRGRTGQSLPSCAAARSSPERIDNFSKSIHGL
jgi:crotonobetainyl-CoA:carnitine CoA-transferase CaiB-like acyl-CoA transferase